MRFAHVTGTLFTDPDGYRIEVTLDMRTSIEVVRSELPALPPGEYYRDDLLGFSVRTGQAVTELAAGLRDLAGKT